MTTVPPAMSTLLVMCGLPTAELDQNEDVLCVVDAIDGNDIGTCEFTVNHPTFEGGSKNYVNAKDGRGNYSTEGANFILEASISASPASGSPGERILVQMVDFPPEQQRSERFCWLATKMIPSHFPAVALTAPAVAPSPSPFPTGPAPVPRN